MGVLKSTYIYSQQTIASLYTLLNLITYPSTIAGLRPNEYDRD